MIPAISRRGQRPSEPMPPPRETASGSVLSGRRPQSQFDAAGLPKLPADEIHPYEAPFVFTAHPRKYGFVRTKVHPDGEWLPTLTPFRLVPGANKVGGGKDRVTDASIANTWLAACGFVVIARNLGPDGDYVREFDVVVGGRGQVRRIYLSAWDHLVLSDAELAEKKFDMVAYRRWLRSLLAQGIVRAPSLAVISRNVAAKNNRIERLSRLPENVPANRKKIAEEQAILALMKGSFASQFGYDPADIEAGYEHFASQLGTADIEDAEDEAELPPPAVTVPPAPARAASPTAEKGQVPAPARAKPSRPARRDPSPEPGSTP